MQLGKLEKVNLRKFWKSEAGDFTPWLAIEENIALLSEAINLDLEVQSQEESVGPFRADILCKDTMTDHYVLIENQLERTDHKHLGQLLTYAAGLDAVTIIWIAENFTEEHRAGLDWLNRITDETINFFGIEIELYKIGDSLAAPKFNIVSKPNDWSKMVKKTAESSEPSETRLMQYEYWDKFKKYIESSKTNLKCFKPKQGNWFKFNLHNRKYSLYAYVNTKKNYIGVDLVFLGLKGKETFLKFRKSYEKALIKEIGANVYYKEDNKKSNSIKLTNSADFFDKNDWENQFKWFKTYLEKFYKFFVPKIKEFEK